MGDATYKGFFHVPLCTKKGVQLPHKEIETYVRSKFAGSEEYTSYYDKDLNEEITSGLPYREDIESHMIDMSTKLLRHRNAPSEIWQGVRPYYWFSIYKEGDSHCLHTHPGAIVAGTYYPYADEDSVPIRFKHPASNLIQMSDRWVNHDDLWHFHQPETGDINVWPAWLEHQIGTQGEVPESRERIAVSFNFGRS